MWKQKYDTKARCNKIDAMHEHEDDPLHNSGHHLPYNLLRMP
jgi:hypothetical protein